MPTQTVEKRKISELKPHPHQKRYFQRRSKQEFLQLARDIKKNGLQYPVRILPDGTILSGHRRVAAAKMLKWKEVDVIVMHEFEGNAAAAEEYFINENFNRRQLSPLEQARCAQGLYELARNGDLMSWQQTEKLQRTRDLVGARLGCSGRHAMRFLRVLETPPSVQFAYDKGKLSITLACRVASLPRDARQLIHEEIKQRGIGKAKEIVKSHLPQKGSTLTGAAKAFGGLVRELDKAVEALDGQVNNLPGCRPQARRVLERAETLIHTILDHDRERKEQFESHMAYLCCGTEPGNGEDEDGRDIVLKNSTGPEGADDRLPEPEVDAMSAVEHDTVDRMSTVAEDTMSTSEHVADSTAV